jgi:hypothetical protein
MRINAAKRLGDDDPSFRTDRLEPGFVRKVERTVELRQYTAGELEHSGETEVNARGTCALPAHDMLRLARKQARDADAVAAEIHQ